MKIKAILGVLSIVLTVTGWFIDHGDRFIWVSNIIAPRYHSANLVYENMLRTKEPIKLGMKGFDEIVAIVRPELSGIGEIIITELQIESPALSFLSTETGMESAQTITLAVTLQDGRKAKQSGVRDLRPRIRDKYLENTFFAWGTTVFWLGILGSIITLGLMIKNEKSA